MGKILTSRQLGHQCRQSIPNLFVVVSVRSCFGLTRSNDSYSPFSSEPLWSHLGLLLRKFSVSYCLLLVSGPRTQGENRSRGMIYGVFSQWPQVPSKPHILCDGIFGQNHDVLVMRLVSTLWKQSSEKTINVFLLRPPFCKSVRPVHDVDSSCGLLHNW